MKRRGVRLKESSAHRASSRLASKRSTSFRRVGAKNGWSAKGRPLAGQALTRPLLLQEYVLKRASSTVPKG